MSLAPMLNHSGKLIGDFTVANAGGDRYFLFGSGVAEEYHLRWFESHLPSSGVAFRSLRTGLLGFAIAGPRSRDLLATLCDDDVSNAALPFLSFCKTEVARVPAFGRAHLVHRRAGLRDLGAGRLSAHAVRQRSCKAEGIRVAPFRRTRAPFAAARKELRQLGARVPADLFAERSGSRSLRRSGKKEFIGRAASLREREAAHAAARDVRRRC